MPGASANGTSLPEGVNRRGALAARWILKLLLKAPVAVLKGFRVKGGERLPAARRPLILACNHAAFVDSVYLILAVRPRFVVCGGKPRLFKNPWRRALMALVNVLEVDGRERYLRDCGALLAAGEILLIYPEMGRNPEAMGAFKTWAAEVALANRAPVLPCYLHGTTCGHRGPVRLVVGREMAPAGDAESFTGRLRQAITDLEPAA